MEKKEAMKILKGFHDKSALFSVRTALETALPELKESEDEMTRKEILNYFKCQSREEPSRKDTHNKWIAWLEKVIIPSHNDTDSSFIEDIKNVIAEAPLLMQSDKEKMIAWLEKQGEQKPEIKYIYPKFRVGDVIEPAKPNGHYVPVRVKYIGEGRYSCESDDRKAFSSIPICNENEYVLTEQKPADKVEPKFKAGDFIADGRRVFLVLANTEERNLGETYSTYCEGLVLDVYGNVLVDGKDFSGFRLATDIERANFVHDLKVGTKIHYKSAELSEEDEPMLDVIISNYECLSEEWLRKHRKDLGVPSEVARKENEEAIAWLKSIKDRVQPKQELSEEDEIGLGNALWAIEQAKTITKDENDMGNLWHAEKWLKSLRPQHHWKPSEEQMDYLKKVYESYYFCDGERSALESLYNDLKKL